MAKQKPLPSFPGVARFLMEEPLYVPFSLNDEGWKRAVPLFADDDIKFDGHCPGCGRNATFDRSDDARYKSFEIYLDRHKVRDGFHAVVMKCARDEDHKLTVWLRKTNDSIEKVGQWPSLATIALDEIKEYKALMEGQNAKEFHRAIGLAAHGVGVGSFLYLRRIFERLIYAAFGENKATQGWTDEEFYRKRMPAKIEQLSKFLPEFLVRNRAVYDILSTGLHELTEDECLAYFEPLKKAIIIIVEQERERQRKQKAQDELEKSIADLRNKIKRAD
jgi:hypothetical protein